jgi:phospholipase A1
VKFQLSLAFPFWRGILGPNSVLGASYTQKSWWQLSNSGESSPFRETNYEPQLFLGFATDYEFAGWTLRDVEWALTMILTAVPIRLPQLEPLYAPDGAER